MKPGKADIKFETDFVISLIVLLISIITLNFVSEIWFYFQTMSVGILHLILLSLIYSTPRGLGYRPTFIDKLVSISKYTLFLLVFSFIYLMIQILSSRFFHTITFILGIPTIIVVILGTIIAYKTGILEEWNKLSILVNPKQFRVYQEYIEDNSILIKICNALDKPAHFQLNIKIPDKIVV